jgi:hypothetical protein
MKQKLITLRRLFAVGFAALALLFVVVSPGAAAPSSHDIVGVKSLGNGVKQYTVLNPTGSATPTQLRSWLNKQGYRTDLVTAAVGCSPHVGTANALCGAKWAYGPFNDPQVYFLDHSGNSWPVTDARVDWYQAPGIDAYYRYYTAGCPGGGRHCVNVYDASYGQTGWYAQTTWQTSGGYFVDGTVQIQLNDSTTPNTYAARRSVACHEMGHALGLDHNTGTTSCIKTYLFQAPAFPQHPTANDFSVLNALYPKPRT